MRLHHRQCLRRAVAVTLATAAVSAQTPLPPKPVGAHRIAVLACLRQDRPAPALARYVEARPDVCLWIGDNIYGDTKDDVGVLTRGYSALAALPGFAELRAGCPTFATWDDHDFGLNDAGRDYALKVESQRLFRAFWRLDDLIPAEQEGIHYAMTMEVGGTRLQFLMLDCRYHREDPETGGDVLGERQWRWLGERLQEPADWRIIVSGFQVLLDRDAGSETWDKFPAARLRLFDLIRRTRAEGVVFLTGDQHYGEVCRRRGALDYDAVELQFAGVNQIEKPERNRSRVSPVIRSRHSVALIDLSPRADAADEPHLLFRIWDATSGQLELAYRVNHAELVRRLSIEGEARFVGAQAIRFDHDCARLRVRYTTDGREPDGDSPVADGPVQLAGTATVKANLFDGQGLPCGRVVERRFEQVAPTPALPATAAAVAGLRYRVFTGRFARLADVGAAKPVAVGVAATPTLQGLPTPPGGFAVRFDGFLEAPEDGMYEFALRSDDGARLVLHDEVVVDNDGSHSARTRTGAMALARGRHPLRIEYFQDHAEAELSLRMARRGDALAPVPAQRLSH